MKYRDYKIFRPGQIYHTFNRGNNKDLVFRNHLDYMVAIERMKVILGLESLPARSNIRPLPIGAFSILAYCLMPNHFHMLIRQNTDIGIDKLMLKFCTSYAMSFNRKYERVGNVFQDTFKAKLVDTDTYAQYVSAYIHNNPGNLRYPYSSYPDIIGLRQGRLVDPSIILSWFNNDQYQYQRFVTGFTNAEEHRIKDYLFEGK